MTPIMDTSEDVQSALSNGATVSTLLIPGDTLTAMMLDL